MRPADLWHEHGGELLQAHRPGVAAAQRARRDERPAIRPQQARHERRAYTQVHWRRHLHVAPGPGGRRALRLHEAGLKGQGARRRLGGVCRNSHPRPCPVRELGAGIAHEIPQQSRPRADRRHLRAGHAEAEEDAVEARRRETPAPGLDGQDLHGGHAAALGEEGGRVARCRDPCVGGADAVRGGARGLHGHPLAFAQRGQREPAHLVVQREPVAVPGHDELALRGAAPRRRGARQAAARGGQAPVPGRRLPRGRRRQARGGHARGGAAGHDLLHEHYPRHHPHRRHGNDDGHQEAPRRALRRARRGRGGRRGHQAREHRHLHRDAAAAGRGGGPPAHAECRLRGARDGGGVLRLPYEAGRGAAAAAAEVRAAVGRGR
mmetsp:Transcript_8329/g.23866  ORF Transcript_8329/g.23866 Transcript_8329/m.23866 type:complete len:378 (-) Transcript_8329:550-1683(-)